MARLPYIDSANPDIDADLVRAVQQRRGGKLLNLDRLLLHSAPLTRGWNSMFGAIRSHGSLDGATRELVILLVAQLNRAPYEFAQHAPIALQEGVTPQQLDALANWRQADVFTARDRDVLAYAEAMTLQVQVPAPLFDAVRTHFDTRELVELTATVAGYNMVSRFLEALQIEIEPV